MRQVLIFAGAGASVGSGVIPEQTIWGHENVDAICSFDAWSSAHEKDDVAQIIHIHNFHKGMQKLINESRANQFHRYVAELSGSMSFDVTVVTSNVDDFFEREGVPAEKIVHLHGSTLRRRCPCCQYRFEDQTDYWQFSHQIERCPIETCRSRLVKTDVLFYGEQSPEYLAGIQAFNRLGAGDIAIMVGSSGQTFKVAQRLWERCRNRNVDTIHINPNETPHHLFPANLPLVTNIADALPELELHLRIQQTIDHVIQE